MLCKRKKYFLIRRCFYLALCITFVILNFFPAKFDSFAANQAITTFYDSYCLIAPNGDLITWGWNTNGLVGNGAMPVYPYWARKTLLSHVSEVYSNRRHCSLALDDSHTLWGWGGYFSLLLQERRVPFDRPVRIMDGVENAAVGSSHISVVKTDGTLWVWGDNSGGQMGVGNRRVEDSASYPQKLMKNVRATFSWFDTTFAIDNNYDLYVWGNEASVAPSDGALYRPDCIASQIQDVSYVGGLKYLLLTTRGEVLVLDAFKAAQEQAYQNAILPDVLAQDVTQFCYQGFLTSDGDRWICEVEGETIKVTCADDREAVPLDSNLWVTRSGHLRFQGICSTFPLEDVSLNTIVPILRNLFFIAIFFEIWMKIFVGRG